MMESGDGREAGGRLVGGLVGLGCEVGQMGMRSCWLESGVELLRVWPWVQAWWRS